jgi:glycosyltransferase involved in cell wall biosynthesis
MASGINNGTKIKVLHILGELKFSGAEIMLEIAAPIFHEQGLESHIVSTGENVGEFSQYLINAGYIVHHVPFSKSLRFYKDLYQLIKKHKFDSVHLHTERSFSIYSFIAKAAGVQAQVRTVHNAFQYKGILRLRKILERFLAKSLAGLKYIAIGDSVHLIERENFLNSSTIIYNWIDEHKFFPAENEMEKFRIKEKLNIPKDKIIILSIGACRVVKNHTAIIEAIENIKKTNSNILYLHIGDGECLQKEKALVEKLKLDSFIRFCGTTDQVRDYLIASDIFVMPSLYEGLGNSLLEAQFCGLPGIIYNSLGLIDIVQKDVNGIITSQSPLELAEAILQLSSDKALRDRMSKAALDISKDKFNMRKSIEAYCSFYKN